jgi:hypothetical protein
MTGPKNALEKVGRTAVGTAGSPGYVAGHTKWVESTEYVYELHLHDLFLMVKRPIITETLFAKHQKILGSGTTVKYYLSKTLTNWTLIPQGVKTFLSPELFPSSAALPPRLYTIIYSQTRMAGSMTENIQKYSCPDSLLSVMLQLDSKPINNFYTPTATTLDNGLWEFLYINMFRSTETLYTQHPPNISFEEFKTTRFILCFDLSPGQHSSEDMLPLLASGSLRLRMDFKEPLDAALHVLTFATTPALMTISNNRHVTMSFDT